jgi:hypothetical protein
MPDHYVASAAAAQEETMPEQISKYPEVTLQVLQGGGARCREGAEQKILKQCPAEQFCSLQSGEICVYGIAQIPQMTQISRQELAQVVCPATSAAGSGPGWMDLGPMSATFVLGLAAGALFQRWKAR